MSSSEVTQDGLAGVRPGREARTWSKGRAARRPQAHDHPGDSYYGRPIINPPVWQELDIAGYLFLGGLAGGSSILASAARSTARPSLARRSGLCASAAITVSLVALIHDLGRPARFLNMLRVFKPSSPMSVGVWLLSAYTPLVYAGSASDLLRRAPRTGRVAGACAAVLGAGVCSYTAALIADTAVPAWHAGHRELPFLFVGSAASAAGGFALLAAPLDETGLAARFAVLGTVGELVAEHRMERRLGVVAETLHTGKAGRRLRLAKALSVAGAVGTIAAGRRHRGAAAAGGAMLVAASALTRFGLFAAGVASAEDPRYTVEPQRARRAAAAGGTAAAGESV
jgi:formate-dependent nitrite reductase membrane component NrfD